MPRRYYNHVFRRNPRLKAEYSLLNNSELTTVRHLSRSGYVYAGYSLEAEHKYV